MKFDDDAQRIEDYLDDRLTGAQRQAFERQLAGDRQLQAMMDQQQRIDQSLHNLYKIPPPNSRTGVSPVIRRAARPTATWLKLLQGGAIAAAVICMGLSVWYVLDDGRPSHQPAAPVQRRTMAQEYHHVVAAGFKPQWLCKTDKQFASTFYRRLGQGLLLRPLATSVTALGLGYGYNLSPRTVFLLAKVDDQPVMVFVDRTLGSPAPGSPGSPGSPATPGGQSKPQLDVPRPLHVYRRQIGDLVLFEVSPLTKPVVLDYFYEPQMPEDWKLPPRWY